MNNENLSFEFFIQSARSRLKGDDLLYPWAGLAHGVELLNSDTELDKYLWAYGAIHKEKVDVALESVFSKIDIQSKSVCVIDWGCGQGLASCCFVDHLRSSRISCNISEVLLIEPSKAALSRAQYYLKHYSEVVSVRPINKFINDISDGILETHADIIIHFFSNILDIQTVDLDHLAGLILSLNNREQIGICIGPANHGAGRIDEFSKKLGLQKDVIVSQKEGLLSKRGTIKLLTFKLQNHTKIIIKKEYYSYNMSSLVIVKQIAKKIQGIPSKTLDRILSYYSCVLELEQRKEPEINQYFPLPLVLKENAPDTIILDLSKDPLVASAFEHNRQTQWPKDLYIGWGIDYKGITYRLFSTQISASQIKDLDINEQVIPCPLNRFSVDPVVAEELMLSEDAVHILQLNLEEAQNHVELEERMQPILSGARMEQFPVVAFSQKKPVLLQTKSEIDHMKASDIADKSLLHSYLLQSDVLTQEALVSEESVISVTQLDESQRKVVAASLNNLVSVVVGPPGTGKTQVILNIIANAVVHGQSVLVASKNNKAVDNVKERFDVLDSLQSLMRFGSRDIWDQITEPSFASLISYSKNLGDKHDSDDYLEIYRLTIERLNLLASQKEEIHSHTDALAESNKLIARYNDELESIVLEREKRVSSYMGDHPIVKNYSNEINSKTIKEWLVRITQYLEYLEPKITGIRKLFYYLLSRAQIEIEIRKLLELIPEVLFVEGIRIDILPKTDIRVLYNSLSLLQHNIESCKRVFDAYEGILSSFKKKEEQLIYKLKKEKKNNQTIKQQMALLPTMQEVQNDYDSTLSLLHSSDFGIKLVEYCIKEKLSSADASKNISNYLQYLPGGIPWDEEGLKCCLEDTKNYLRTLPLNSVTSLSAKSSFLPAYGLFDILVIDEASQCDIISAIPLIMRAKKLVVIGDPMQLRHITAVQEEEETFLKSIFQLSDFPFAQYRQKSLWDYCQSWMLRVGNNDAIMALSKHYRCHPDIIRFSNDYFYRRQMNLSLEICTPQYASAKGVVWVNTQGQQTQDMVNSNVIEAKKALNIAYQELQSSSSLSVGILTPFRHQVELIHELLKSQDPSITKRITVDTINKFQGDEKDVIIFSLVVTDNSPSSKIRWIDCSIPNLVNVAITRARKTLYIVGNKNYILAHSSSNKPLGALAKYVEHKN